MTASTSPMLLRMGLLGFTWNFMFLGGWRWKHIMNHHGYSWVMDHHESLRTFKNCHDILWTYHGLVWRKIFAKSVCFINLYKLYTPRLGKVLHQMFVLDLIRKLCFKIMLKIGGVNPADIITVGSKVVPPPSYVCWLYNIPHELDQYI